MLCSVNPSQRQQSHTPIKTETKVYIGCSYCNRGARRLIFGMAGNALMGQFSCLHAAYEHERETAIVGDRLAYLGHGNTLFVRHRL